MTALRPSGVEEPADAARSYGARANASARRRFAPRYLLNTLRNIPVIAGSADVAVLFGVFTGVPAVVVAAGPSLDQNIQALRQARGRAILIAVDTALRPLLEAGIEPDLVVALDPSEINARHLRNLPDTRHTWLVAEGSLNSGAFEQFGGRTFTFAVSDHEPWPWLRSVGLGRGQLRAWGSVLTSALDLALRCGCDPIVFAGADLAYTGQRPYCRGTVYEHDWALRTAQGEPLTAVWAQMTAAKARLRSNDIHGRPVPTSQALLAFRDWIVKESVAHAGRRFINATGDGVLVGGRIEQCPLTDALPTVDRPPVPALSLVANAWHTWRATHPSDTSDFPRALAAVRETGAGAEPLAAWLNFGAPDLSADSVTKALEDARHGLAGHWPPGGPGPALRARGVPERVLTIRSAIAGLPLRRGDDANGAVNTAPAGCDAALRSAQARASRCLSAILSGGNPLISPGALSCVAPEIGTPATRAYNWNPGAMPLLLEYETALADVITAGSTVATRDERWLLASLDMSAATADVPSDSVATPAADLAPSLALLADGLSVAAGLEGDGGHLQLAAALVRAYARALEPNSPAPATGTEAPIDAAVSVTVAGRRFAQGCASRARGVAEALTGVFVSVPLEETNGPAGDGRLPAVSVAVPALTAGGGVAVSLSMQPIRQAPSARGVTAPWWLRAARSRPPDGRIMPVRVNPPGMPCLLGGTWDNAHALFTVVNGTHGIRVDATGRWAPDTAWPRAVSGQIRWGQTGVIAWHSGDGQVLWREHPDGDVHTSPMPLVGARAFPQPDGAIWWTSVRGGLWSWRPGGEWRRLVDTPPLMGLQRHTGGVRLEPRGPNLSFAVREPLAEAFEWTPGSDSVAVAPLGPEGPCWSVATADAWTALAFPHVDAVSLRHRDGREHVLTCQYPVNVAWAGTSLAVSTGAAEVLLFPNLIHALTHQTERATRDVASR